MNKLLLSFFSFMLSLFPAFVLGLTFSLPASTQDVVGEIQAAAIEPGDNFSTLGRRFDVGYFELIEANPKINPDKPVAWRSVVIPTRFILPPVAGKEIVVNLAELRLYYFEPNQGRVVTFPIGVGRQGWGTPLCLTRIIDKRHLPVWHVPESIRLDREKDGVHLPKMVLPGPDNPLGDYAMRLAVSGGTYLMHGTNDSSGVGRRSSSGCIRMFPEDIEELFSLVNVGTAVQIINEPAKIGWDGKSLYLEVHEPLQEDEKGVAWVVVLEKIEKEAKKHHVEVNFKKAHDVVEDQLGIPTVISLRPAVSSNLASRESNEPKKAEVYDVDVIEPHIADEPGAALQTPDAMDDLETVTADADA